MSATKTEAFVLKTQDYRDTSLLGSFYTKDYGKIQGIVKGVRDSRGRFGSSLEPFSLNEILFYPRRHGGDLCQVTQVDVVDMFGAVREDLERVGAACYFVELVHELVDIGEPNSKIFKLLYDSLEFLAQGASPKRVARVFELKFLELLGLSPETRVCVVCGSEPGTLAFFNIGMGGIVCQKCRLENQSSLPVSRGTLNFLEHVKRSSVKELANVKVSQEVGEDLERILRRVVDFQLPRKLKSVTFMEKMGMK